MNKIFCFFATAAMTMLAACSSDEIRLTNQEVQMPRELRFRMDVEKPSFDGTTRAGGAGWEQGDSLFLRFTKAGGYAYAIAEFESSTGDWVIKDAPALDLEETKKLELAFFDGSKTVNGQNVTLSPTTAVYTDDGNGTYLLTMANNFVPVIKGNLVPRTARLRFKGEAGTTVTVSGLKYNKSFNTSSRSLTTATDAIALTVGSDGYTPYTYCAFADNSRKLTVIQDISVGAAEYRYTYTATCSATMLQTGKSGWMNLPTYTNHDGWEMKAEALHVTPSKTSVEMPGSASSQTISIDANITWSVTSSASWLTCNKKSNTELTLTATANTADTERSATVSIKDEKGAVKATIAVKQKSSKINGHEYVDLGLPSGLLWATCNVGATRPEDCGGYYAWGETKEKSDYSWSSYLKDLGGTMTSYSDCGTSKDPLKDYVYPNNKSIGGTNYDVARQSWGGTWRMPTYDEMNELVTKCTTTWTTQGGVYGRKVTGPNGNTIFLPAAGYKSGTSLSYGPTSSNPTGYYWTSSPTASSAFGARFLYFDSGNFHMYNNYRYNGRTVRPVSE